MFRRLGVKSRVGNGYIERKSVQFCVLYFFKSMTKSGVYIHIPFCSSRCSYCDFATGLYKSELANRYVQAVVKEIESFAQGDVEVDTIYFGGGTPSLLTAGQLKQLLDATRRTFRVKSEAEITLELNPGSTRDHDSTSASDSLSTLIAFRERGINRVSFGAQTFDDRELARLGRSHDSKAIHETFSDLRKSGFENISFDLIAGLPGQTITGWERNVDQALQLRPEHLSFYLLEVHHGTPLAEQIKQGKQPQPDADLAAEMYEIMLDRALVDGYQHYEISNLCLPGFESRHNSKYWTGQPYFGFGCSAHSYDGSHRRWSNERDIHGYLKQVNDDVSPIVESQYLTEAEARAEAMFLGLRMLEGIDIHNYHQHFGVDVREEYREQFELFREAGLLELDDERVRLTRSGALLSNEIFAAFV